MINIKVITIVGRPNVGKSTLFNHLLGKKTSITTLHPHTTRNSIKSVICVDNNNFIGLIDTPGFHDPKNYLDKFLNNEFKKSVVESNIIMVLSDLSRELNNEDLKVFNFVKNIVSYNQNIIVCLTKNDLVNVKQIENRKNELEDFFGKDIYIIDTNYKDINFCEKVINKIKEIKSEYLVLNNINEWEEKRNDNFLIQEIIRETAISFVNQEIPYGIAVIVNEKNYDAGKNVFYIDAEIYVEKENHKGILIGKMGNLIKKIGSLSRKKLNAIFDCKIYLALKIKVNKNWRKKINSVKNMGYK